MLREGIVKEGLQGGAAALRRVYERICKSKLPMHAVLGMQVAELEDPDQAAMGLYAISNLQVCKQTPVRLSAWECGNVHLVEGQDASIQGTPGTFDSFCIPQSPAAVSPCTLGDACVSNVELSGHRLCPCCMVQS